MKKYFQVSERETGIFPIKEIHAKVKRKNCSKSLRYIGGSVKIRRKGVALTIAESDHLPSSSYTNSFSNFTTICRGELRMLINTPVKNN